MTRSPIELSWTAKRAGMRGLKNTFIMSFKPNATPLPDLFVAEQRQAVRRKGGSYSL